MWTENNRARISLNPVLVFVLLIIAALAIPSTGFALVIYEFESPSTGFSGQIMIDDTDASFAPSSTISIGGAITDFTFTFVEPPLNTYTPDDLEIVPLALEFSASGTNPDDIIRVEGSYRDLAPPQGNNIRFEFGGIDSGGSSATNGNFTGASTGILSFSDGTFSAVPEPATMLLIGTGLFGLVGFRRKFRK